MKTTILNHVDDLVSNFLYYDRKNDEDLKVGDIEQAVAEGVITVDEIVARFRSEIEDRLV